MEYPPAAERAAVDRTACAPSFPSPQAHDDHAWWRGCESSPDHDDKPICSRFGHIHTKLVNARMQPYLPIHCSQELRRAKVFTQLFPLAIRATTPTYASGADDIHTADNVLLQCKVQLLIPFEPRPTGIHLPSMQSRAATPPSHCHC